MAPWADMLYFADVRWWRWHREREEYKRFAGVKVTIDGGDRSAVDSEPELFWLHNHGGSGISTKPNGLMTGQNGGYQAINIAVLAGAKRVLLLGYDMKLGKSGKSHFFGDHPIKTDAATFSAMLQNFPTMLKPLKALGVEVINCTPDSALRCFPLHALESLLPDPAAAALPA